MNHDQSNRKESTAASFGTEMLCIIDANAFTINRDEMEANGEQIIMHKPVGFSGVTVTSACGAVAYSDYFNVYEKDFAGDDVTTKKAEWAGGFGGEVECAKCKEIRPNW